MICDCCGNSDLDVSCSCWKNLEEITTLRAAALRLQDECNALRVEGGVRRENFAKRLPCGHIPGDHDPFGCDNAAYMQERDALRTENERLRGLIGEFVRTVTHDNVAAWHDRLCAALEPKPSGCPRCGCTWDSHPGGVYCPAPGVGRKP